LSDCNEAAEAEQELVPPMTTVISAEFIAERGGAIETRSSEHRCRMLRNVTDLFVLNASRLEPSQFRIAERTMRFESPYGCAVPMVRGLTNRSRRTVGIDR